MLNRILCQAGLLLLAAVPGRANNLSITDVTVVSTTQVQFNISWDNSWYAAALNWDAVWVFVKAQDCTGNTTWDHVDLSTTAANHTATGGTGLFIEASTDGKGIFVRRNSVGGGTQNATITVQFAAAMPAAATTNFFVYGIEMVWVPQGNFTVGDGSTTTAQSTNSFSLNNTMAPYSITSEALIGPDMLRNDAADPVNETLHNQIPAAFPKGWNGFYCMKYEISQQQYLAFLNTLTTAQQAARTANPPGSATGTLAMTNAANQNRNAIVVMTPATGTAPAVYATDLNGDGTYGDGDDIACNYLSWTDLLAYLDWSGLRPMTELEYEKAARGPLVAVNGEYAWGNNTNILAALSNALNNPGTPSENSTVTGAGLCTHNAGASTTLGPLRTGFAANASSSRVTSGSSHWGIMELSGNVWEQTIAVGNFNGTVRIPPTLIFTGANGDGRLSLGGDTDVTTWPGLTAFGNTPAGTVLVRGGNWEYTAQRAQISDRNFLNSVAENLTRVRRTGGRGVRRP